MGSHKGVFLFSVEPPWVFMAAWLSPVFPFWDVQRLFLVSPVPALTTKLPSLHLLKAEGSCCLKHGTLARFNLEGKSTGLCKPGKAERPE